MSVTVPTQPPVGVRVFDAGLRALRRWTWLAIPIAVLVVYLGNDPYYQYVAGFVLIYAMSALGLDWLMGRAGVVSLGNGAIMAFGALSTAYLTQAGWTFLPTLALVAVLGAALGVLLSLPALRLHGVYFALVTLALQIIVVFVGRRYQASDDSFVAGVPIPRPAIGSWQVEFGRPWLLVLSLLLGISVLLLANLYRSQLGRSWMAIRENELAARTIGVRARAAKFAAFVGSTALISLSGGLLAFYNGRVSSDSFTLVFAISFVVMVIVGGLRSMSGVFLGAVIVTVAPLMLGRYAQGLPPLADGITGWFKTNVFFINSGLFGLLVLVILLYMPRGIVPTVSTAVGRLIAWNARRGQPVGRTAPQSRPHLVVGPEPGDASADRSTGRALLVLEDVHLTYRNGAKALAGVDLSVVEGEVIGVVGRNGVGKTSLMRAITGFYRTEGVRLTGSLRIDGRELLRSSPITSSQLGVALVPERDKVFAELTVEEHLRHVGVAEVAREVMPGEWSLFDRYWKKPAGQLSGGERQLLALAVAASLRPRLLLVDELSLGLSPVAIQRVTDAVARLADGSNATVILVEQNVPVALDLCDRVLLMEGGQLVTTVHDLNGGLDGTELVGGGIDAAG